MGLQYKTLKDSDIEFIKHQKLFYLASSSGKEVNLSPKGYDSIRVLDNSTLVFMNYPGSGNRTYRDAKNDGEFTLVFNAFEGKANITRIFCKAIIIDAKSEKFAEYLKLFREKESLVRDIFQFNIYAVESSCGESVPKMDYVEDRKSLKNWVKKMDKNNKLQDYKANHITPPDLKSI
ncbi:hypothetical protein [Sulfurimonas sp.]|uniref:hypothetical protein n=1 Tax=Sulfurimonas sp. TaxID=2022749 RepID=UPI0035668B80